jgi:hypothetical protein
MTAGRLPRRLIVGTTSAALLAGAVGFVPLLGSASAAACPSWTDPADDSGVITPLGTDPSGMSADSDLDIVSTTVSFASDGAMTVVVKVKGLKDVGPDASAGDEFVINSSVAGTATKVTLARDTFISGSETAKLAAAASVVGTAKFDVAASTVTGTFTGALVKTAFGKDIAGLKMDGFETLAYGYTLTPAGPALGFPEMDEAVAPAALSYTDAGGCGDAAGTPAPTDTPTASPPPAPTPTPGGLFDQPRKGCVQYKDATGDAQPDPAGADQEDALDVTQVNLKSPDGQLQVFVGLVDPSAALFPLFNGPLYNVALTVGGKAVELSAPGDGPATATVGGTANSDIKATAKVDTKAKNIVFTVPLDGLSKAVGSPVAAGTAITGTAITTQADTDLGALDADSAAGTTAAEKSYAYGDNTCFKPPPGVLTLDADASGQYGDRTELFATLKDADDSPVSGVAVTALIAGGKPVTVTTDEDGIADVFLPLTTKAGTKAITATFAGNDVVGPASAVGSFKVVAEKTVLKAVAIKGGVKATVLDDDKHPVAGRTVLFVIGAKKKAVKTNAKGIAVLTGVAKGTAVKVSFPAVPGFYLGTPTYTVKAL